MKIFYKINKTTKTTLTALVLATVITMGFYACKKPNEGVNLLVNTSSLSKSPMMLSFTNANTSSATTLPANFAVSITGTGAKYVQADGGGTDFKVIGGLLPLSLTAAASPSPGNPIVFNVYAVVPGFAPISKTVAITNTATYQSAIKVIELASLPAGTSIATGSSSLNAGTATSAVTIATATNGTMTEKATLTIPANTKMLDASGAAINASALSASVLQYGTGSAGFGSIFPGGLKTPDVIGSNGTAIPGGVTFISAGLLAIDMTAGTTPVKGFSQPVQIAVELKSGLINYITHNPVQAGETIPVWSRNESTGQWKSDGVATVALNASNKLVATTTISHLSNWQFAWETDYSTMYFHPLIVRLIPSKIPWVSSSSNYDIQLQDANGTPLFTVDDYVPQNDFFKEFINEEEYNYQYGVYGFKILKVPNVFSAKVVVHDKATGSVFAQSGLFDPTSTSSVDINITTPYILDETAIFNVSGACPNKNVSVSTPVWISIYNTDRKINFLYHYTGKYSNEKLFSAGDTYTLSTVYANTTYTTVPFKIAFGAYASIAPAQSSSLFKLEQISDSQGVTEFNLRLTLDCK